MAENNSGHPTGGLYDEGRHYDLLMPGPNDLPFYERQARKFGGPVLELACGTGRLTTALRLAGIDITGLDNSPAMLEVAHRKAERSGVEIDYVHADVRSFSLDHRFRLIFIANNSLSHLLRLEDVEAFLHRVQQHLAPEGRLIVDIFTPAIRFLARDPAQRYPVGEYEDPDGLGHVTVSDTYRYDPATQVSHSIWHYQRAGDGMVWDVPLDMRMFYPQEIDALLKYNGFAIENKYGEFDETPYDSGSPKQVIVCRKQELAT